MLMLRQLLLPMYINTIEPSSLEGKRGKHDISHTLVQ